MFEFWSYFVPAISKSVDGIYAALLWNIPLLLFAILFGIAGVFRLLSDNKLKIVMILYLAVTVYMGLMFSLVKVGWNVTSMPEKYQGSYTPLIIIGIMWVLALMNIIVSVVVNYIGYRWKVRKGWGMRRIVEETATNPSWHLNSVAIWLFCTGALMFGFTLATIVFPGGKELPTTGKKIEMLAIILIGVVLAVIGFKKIRRIPLIIYKWFPRGFSD